MTALVSLRPALPSVVVVPSSFEDETRLSHSLEIDR